MKQVSIEEFYCKNKVPENFDEISYAKGKPELEKFYQPHCKNNNINEKHRLYFHYVMYGQKYRYDYRISYLEKYQDIKNNTEYEKIIKTFNYHPKISILLSCYNSNLDYLSLCVNSVLNQIYQNWELVIVDDGTNSEDLTSFLNESSMKDDRINVISSGINTGISTATNIAIDASSGEYCQILDHDDILETDCLFHIIANLNEKPNTKWIYFDERCINEKNSLNGIIKKPQPDIFIQMSRPYMSTHAVFAKQLLNKVDGFRQGYEGCQDHDLGLRLLHHVELDDILHIPLPLYMWRQHDGSFSKNNTARWHSAGEESIKEFVKDKYNLDVAVDKRNNASGFDIIWPIDHNKKICLVILTHSKLNLLQNCINSILDKTSYKNYEIILVCNNATQEILSYAESIQKDNIKYIVDNRVFNWAASNNYAAKLTDADYLVFLNDDVEVITENWLEKMSSVCSLPEVGTVGAKLLFDNNTIQHIGVFSNDNLIPFHPERSKSNDEISLFSHDDHCSLANTGACVMVSKAYFNKLGGFNERLPEGYNDVDFGYRTIQDGRINITKIDAVLYHHETQTRGNESYKKFCNVLAKKYIVSHTAHHILLDKQNINAFHIPVPRYTENSYKPLKPILAIIHIPKAAGSAIRQYYTNYFGTDRVTYLNGPNMLKIYDGDIQEINSIKKFIFNKKILTSHFPYGIHNILQQKMQYATFLRQPIKRILSQYHFMVKSVFNSKKILPIEEMLENGMLCSNLMTKQIAGLPPENVSYNEAELGPNCFYMNTVGFRFPREFWLYNDQLLPKQEKDNDELLNKAIANIEDDFLFVGTQENLEKDVSKLNELLGIQNQEMVPIVNANHDVYKIDEQTKKLIEKYNALDIELYNYIKSK